MLPHFLKTFFWDYDFRSIRWETDRDLVTARIVSQGSWDAIIWLRSVISDKELKKWIVQRKGAGISPERMRFWELILKLSHKTGKPSKRLSVHG